MSDLTTGYILGQIAESYFKGLEDTAVAIMAPAKAPQRQIDVHALVAENQALHNDNAYLRADNARLQSNADKLMAWGDRLYAELVKIKGH